MKNKVDFDARALRWSATVCAAPVAACPTIPTSLSMATRCGWVCDHIRAPHLIVLTLAVAIALLAGCSKTAADKPADALEKTEAQTKSGVTIDTKTQTRIGLETAAPAASQLTPEMKAYGRVLDPAPLVDL